VSAIFNFSEYTFYNVNKDVEVPMCKTIIYKNKTGKVISSVIIVAGYYLSDQLTYYELGHLLID